VAGAPLDLSPDWHALIVTRAIASAG
jgi:hypothetical protein